MLDEIRVRLARRHLKMLGPGSISQPYIGDPDGADFSSCGDLEWLRPVALSRPGCRGTKCGGVGSDSDLRMVAGTAADGAEPKETELPKTPVG
jgi:hypothetical protein